MGQNGQWLIQKRPNKRSVKGIWSIDKYGENGVEAIKCGFFFIKQKRLKIYRDAKCDRKFEKRTDKLIGTKQGSAARASSLSGDGGVMEISAIASKTKKDGKTKSDFDIEMTFLSEDNLANQKISTPIKEIYLQNTDYTSTFGGYTVDQIKTMR